MSSSYWNTIKRSTAIVPMFREGCTGHSRPCDGCDDYCDIHEDNAARLGKHDLYDAYGEFQCQGEQWWHKTYVWQVTIECVPHRGPAVTVNGVGQSLGEAELDAEQAMLEYEAKIAAKLIADSRFNGYEDQ